LIRSSARTKNPSVGQVLLMSKDQLEQVVLPDPHVKVYSCGQRDIEAGSVDRRILAVIEFLADGGLDPMSYKGRPNTSRYRITPTGCRSPTRPSSAPTRRPRRSWPLR
jgi:hypothetical protein